MEFVYSFQMLVKTFHWLVLPLIKRYMVRQLQAAKPGKQTYQVMISDTKLEPTIIDQCKGQNRTIESLRLRSF